MHRQDKQCYLPNWLSPSLLYHQKGCSWPIIWACQKTQKQKWNETKRKVRVRDSECMLFWSLLSTSFLKPVKHRRSGKSSDDSAYSLEELFRGIKQKRVRRKLLSSYCHTHAARLSLQYAPSNEGQNVSETVEQSTTHNDDGQNVSEAMVRKAWYCIITHVFKARLFNYS